MDNLTPDTAALRAESDEWPFATHWSVFWTGSGEPDREPCDCTIGEDHKRGSVPC